MGEPQADASLLAKGAMVAGRYRIVRSLAEGGMGQVYVALDTKVSREIALKILHAQHSGRLDIVARFRREATAASSVGHEGVITFTDSGYDGELRAYYLVSELVRGVELRARMRAGNLTKADLFEILLQVAAAVQAAHEKNVIHRDLKPENILVGSDRRGLWAKVLDFGIAKVLDAEVTEDNRTKTNVALGTPGYMSPEQFTNAGVDPRSDVFALGCILYECLTGIEPFDGSSLYVTMTAMKNGQRTPLEDPELEAIVSPCLVWDRDQRTPSAKAFAEALEAYQARHPEVTWVAHAPSITPAPPSGVGNNLPTPAEPATSSLAPNPVIEISRPPASEPVIEAPRKPTVTSWSGEAPILPPSILERAKRPLMVSGALAIALALVLLALPHKQAQHARLVATAPVTVVNPSDAATTVVAVPATDANTVHPVARAEMPTPTPTPVAEPPVQTPIELQPVPTEERRHGHRDRGHTLREQRNGHALPPPRCERVVVGEEPDGTPIREWRPRGCTP